MKKALILAALLAGSFSAMAEDEKVVKKRIVMAGDGELTERIEEIIEEVEAVAGDDGNVHVVVKQMHNGEMDVKEYVTSPGEFERRHAGKMHGPLAMAHRGMMHPMPNMSTGAANCVLKNIRNAASDAAARAVVQACTTLNPAEEN